MDAASSPSARTISRRASRPRRPAAAASSSQPFCLVSNWSLFKERHYLDRTELRRDILRIRVFYWKRGWRDAQVDTAVTPKDGGVRVEFKVTEGPPTRISSIRVERPGEVLSDNEVRNVMKVRAGDPLNLIALDSSIVFLEMSALGQRLR